MLRPAATFEVKEQAFIHSVLTHSANKDRYLVTKSSQDFGNPQKILVALVQTQEFNMASVVFASGLSLSKSPLRPGPSISLTMQPVHATPIMQRCT